MSGSYLKITGCQTGRVGDKWPPRKEFDTFLQDKKQTVLFFLALSKLCLRPLSDTLSHFQLGGIHGLPRRPWPRDATNVGNGSYCVHGEATFVTWHRVYCLAYEQALSEIILKFVDPSSTDSPIPVGDRPNWKVAAETWRLPYWDFALRRSYNQGMASVPEQAMIDGDPLGPHATGLFPTPPTIPDNPLFAYRYPLRPGETLAAAGLETTNGQPLTIQKRTVRHAPRYTGDVTTTKIWTEGISNVTSLKTTFRNRTAGWRTDLVSLLRNTTTFDGFVMGGDPAGPLPDLNTVHGSVHIATGGGSNLGTMGAVPCAGLDPIFFIYHAGIDRLAAMWQAGHADTSVASNWLTSSQNRAQLVPFRNKTGALFTSSELRNWENWGYTYEDTATIRDRPSLVAKALQLYSDTVGRGNRGPAPGVPEFPILTPDYVFSCSFPSNAIGPFELNVYVEVEGTRHVIGEIVNFVAPLGSGCGNCDDHREAGHTLFSSTYITPELKVLCDKGYFESFDTGVCEPFMAENLKWALYALGDEDHELDIVATVPSMKIAVTRRDKQYRDGIQDPGDAPEGVPPTKVVATVPVRSITAGKPGGLGEGEDLV